MRVGIYCESVPTDGALYGALLEGLLGEKLELVEREVPGGYFAIARDFHVILGDFQRRGASLALAAVDNDTGLGRPRHAPEHEGRETDHETCRRCNLTRRVAHDDDGRPRRLPVAVAVPAPSIEAWLVAAREPDRHDVEQTSTPDLKYMLYRSKAARRARVEKHGLPLARLLGADPAVRDRVAVACPSFAALLRSLEAARQQLP